jgi:integrase
MKRYIKPVAREAGINKNIGWHTFRHSFGTLLKANGEDVKTVQGLLRHANSRITLDVYTQAVNSHKRAAQSKVVRMMVPNLGRTTKVAYPQLARYGSYRTHIEPEFGCHLGLHSSVSD